MNPMNRDATRSYDLVPQFAVKPCDDRAALCDRLLLHIHDNQPHITNCPWGIHKSTHAPFNSLVSNRSFAGLDNADGHIKRVHVDGGQPPPTIPRRTGTSRLVHGSRWPQFHSHS